MGYLSDINPNSIYGDLPGEGPLINAKIPPEYVRLGLGQEMIAPGNLRLPPYGMYGNGSSLASMYGNGVPFISLGTNPFSGIADSTYNLNIETGTGGGGSGNNTVDDNTIPFLNVSNAGSTDTISLVGDLTTASDPWGAAVNGVVQTGAFKSIDTISCNVGGVGVAAANSDISILGDDTNAVSNGTNYLKATGNDSSDVITLSFERFLCEKFEGDTGGTKEAPSKAAKLKILGGAGITTECSTDSTDVTATISASAGAALVRITSVVAADGASDITRHSEDSGTDEPLSVRQYTVTEITPDVEDGTRVYRTGTSTFLWDFTKEEPNQPTNNANVPSTLTEQLLKVGTVITAQRATPGSQWYGGGATECFIRGGVGVFNATCT
ncbi:MAG: hypothetical protein CMH52_02935 [Myxococcales bacterium]|nr:hypothetical protein [Myxococcales bacterium]|tara:strand:- start:473 stop:1618 length:1146 start_codon:yes stop_codon:yes gene_type:complete